MTEEQLTALLRIKRYEQPPADYFDQLLTDIHRRQRSELLHRPLWKIAIERMQTFFGEHSMGHLSYAGAMAAVLVAGVVTIGLITPGGNTGRGGGGFADKDLKLPPSAPLIALQPVPAPRLDSQLRPPSPPTTASGVYQPRYVMDVRPASYEPSSSFNF